MSQKLRGFVGQGMNGRRSYSAVQLEVVKAAEPTSGTGSITATKPCQALIYALGPGASGQAGANPAGGGGGGAALFKRVRLGVGETISWSVGVAGAALTSAGPGNSATDTTVTLPRGVVLTAGGGKAGAAGIGGVGGIAQGGDTNRNGGVGGSGAAGGGSGGPGGGAGGAAGAGQGGGGGGAGFSEIASTLAGGAGSDGNGVGASSAGANYGGGSGGSGSALGTGAGAAGRVLVWLVRPY